MGNRKYNYLDIPHVNFKEGNLEKLQVKLLAIGNYPAHVELKVPGGKVSFTHENTLVFDESMSS